MRGSTLRALILTGIVLAIAGQFSTALAQKFIIFPANHDWKYLATASDIAFCLSEPPTGWETTGYDDGDWLSGPGVSRVVKIPGQH